MSDQSGPRDGVHERRHGDHVISTDRRRFDVDVFHRFLSEQSYWARGRTRSTTDAALERSLVFGVYAPDGSMVGAARLVTDCSTFAWVCDVFVLEEMRGRGLGRALMEAIVSHPCVADSKRALLATHDAHGLYAAHGFEPLAVPGHWMERLGDTH
jgi:GNAT superfamily N-acetyltransferase